MRRLEGEAFDSRRCCGSRLDLALIFWPKPEVERGDECLSFYCLFWCEISLR